MPQWNERGAAVLFSLGVIIVLGTLGSSFLLRSLSERQLGQQSGARQRAFFLAEAAVDQASINLRSPEDLTDDVTTGTLPTGTFQVESPVPLGDDQWEVIARGVSDQAQRRMEVVFQLTPESVFQYPVFGAQQVNISGSATTDSYDSRSGPYDDDPDSPGYNVGHHGDIGTNADAEGGITVDGSIFVDGQVVVGFETDDPESVVSGYDPAFITGGTDPPSDTQDVVSQPLAFPFPAVEVPVGLTCGDHTVTGSATESLTAGGTYCYRNLTLQGGATLTANGPVTVYIIGQLEAQGNSILGVSSDPGQFVVLMPSTGDVILEQGTLTGATGFFGALYAPDSEITISGNAEIYGAIIANQVNVTGSAEIHYDEALEQVTQITNLFSTALVSWQELGN